MGAAFKQGLYSMAAQGNDVIPSMGQGTAGNDVIHHRLGRRKRLPLLKQTRSSKSSKVCTYIHPAPNTLLICYRNHQ